MVSLWPVSGAWGGTFRFCDWFGVGWEAQISMITLGKKFSHSFVALCLFCTRNGTGGRSIGGQLQRPDMGLSFFRVSNIKVLVMPRQLTCCSQGWG